MSIDFSDFIDALDDDPFDEIPVDVYTFVMDKKFLGQPNLSEAQYTLVECMSQIYREVDVARITGDNEHFKKYTKNEVILQLGKGSGKDFTSTIGVAYLVYKLLCLKDPAHYFGKPPGDAIDIINIAINAEQAKNVFFKGFKNKIERSPWFRGKFDAKTSSVEFDKAITVFSGHSERESHEGLNLILAVLDEIAGFQMGEVGTTDLGKTAENIYKAYRASVSSRFPEFGKLILLSFPRYKGDFITTRYDEVVAEKETLLRTHEFIVNEDLPDDASNKFSIEWEEDHIVAYKVPKVFALRRPTWEVNPTIKLENLKMDFFTDPADALMRFACMPPIGGLDTFFRQRDKVEAMMKLHNPVGRGKVLDESFKPDPTKRYFIHADLAQTSDKCAVAIAHVDRWVKTTTVMGADYVAPFVVVDAIGWWEPKKEGIVDLGEVKNWILNFRNVGFNLGLVTFDRWNSVDMQKSMIQAGLRSEILSVAKKHYDDLALLVYEERILCPFIDILLDELLSLKVMPNGKIDHPRKKSKDLSDALCGAVVNAITNTPRELNKVIDVHTWSRSKEIEKAAAPEPIPHDIREFLIDLKLI